MFFNCDNAFSVTLTFDVRMNNALRAAMITWFQHMPAIVVRLYPRDPPWRFLHISACNTARLAAIIMSTSIGTRSAFFFNESRRTKVPKLYGKESMSSGTF